MSSLSQIIHGILETYTNDNSELDYDKIVTLATFGLIILSSTDSTFVDKIRQQIFSMRVNFMADYYLYDKLEPYLIRRGKIDKDIPLIEVIYQFGTEMGNTHIDFSNTYKTSDQTTQMSLFDAFNSIARVLYQSMFCCKLVEIKDMMTSRSLRSIAEPLKLYLTGIFKIVDKSKSKILPKYRFVYFDGSTKPPDWVYKSKSPIETALDNTAYIFKKSSILPSRDPKGGISLKAFNVGLLENANSFFIKPINNIALNAEIKKKTHGLQKQIIIVENFDESTSTITVPPNIETVIISVNPTSKSATAAPMTDYIKYITKVIIDPSIPPNKKFIKLSYNGCSLKKYSSNEEKDDTNEYTYDDNAKKPDETIKHREETIEHVVLNEVNVIINAINDEAAAMKVPDFSGVTSALTTPSGLGTTSALGTTSGLGPCLIMVYPIALNSVLGDGNGIYDPTPDMRNNITVYRKRTDPSYRIYFEDSYWKIVKNDKESVTLISRCDETGNQFVSPNTLKSWTNGREVLDLKTYFEKSQDVTEILYELDKMTTMRVIRDKPYIFIPSTAPATYQCKKEGDYINILEHDDLVPYGLVKITRSVVKPFVYMGALIYDSATKETWGKGRCTYENGDKYTGIVMFTDKDEILPKGEGILEYENGDVCEGTISNGFICEKGKYTPKGEKEYII